MSCTKKNVMIYRMWVKHWEPLAPFLSNLVMDMEHITLEKEMLYVSDVS
jgi:hypothetical protein